MSKLTTKSDNVTKSDLKELRKEINGDIKTHMGVLYEKFSGDISLLAEQFQDTSKIVGSLDKRVGSLDKRVGSLDYKVGSLDKRVGSLEGKMDLLVDTVGEIKVDVTEIKDKLNQKADIAEVKHLSKRVLALEAK